MRSLPGGWRPGDADDDALEALAAAIAGLEGEVDPDVRERARAEAEAILRGEK